MPDVAPLGVAPPPTPSYALRSLRRDASSVGYAAVLAGGALYVPVTVWHFIAHADGADPEVAHVLLALANGILLAGVIAAMVTARRGRPPGG